MPGQLVLRIFIDERERIALPYAPAQNEEMTALLQEFWPRLAHEGRLAVFVEEQGPGGCSVLHFIGRAT